jgi:hypothetical protein
MADLTPVFFARMADPIGSPPARFFFVFNRASENGTAV